MDDPNEYFSKWILKKDRTVKAICAPLHDCLKIPLFCYYRLYTNGDLVNLSNCPEELEVYYIQELYLNDPHVVHPHLLRSGSIFFPTAFDPGYMKKVCTESEIKHLLLIMQCSEEYVEGFFFGTKVHGDNNHANLFTRLDLLYNFTRYFKREAHSLIERAHKDACNFQKIRGAVFLKSDHYTPLRRQDLSVQQFLNAILPLFSSRTGFEQFKQGKTAQNTGAILGLSQRTVESYFENIMMKLGCHSKRDLLEW